MTSYKMFELSSLATALDMQKVLAEQAHEIHSEVTVRKKKYHDAEVRTGLSVVGCLLAGRFSFRGNTRIFYS